MNASCGAGSIPEYSIDKILLVLFSLVLTLVLFNIKRSSMLQLSALNFLFITNDWCHRLCCDLLVDRKKLLRITWLGYQEVHALYFNIVHQFQNSGDSLFLGIGLRRDSLCNVSMCTCDICYTEIFCFCQNSNERVAWMSILMALVYKD